MFFSSFNIRKEIYSYFIIFLSSMMYLFWLQDNKVAGISLALLVLFSLPYVFINLRFNKVILLSFVAILYLYISTYYRVKFIGDDAVRFKYTEILASFFIFISVGIAMGISRYGKKIIVYSLLLGAIIYLLTIYNVADWKSVLNGSRVDFGIRNAQHSGSVFLLLFLVSLLITDLKNKAVIYTLSFLFFILMLAGQVRAILLGLVVASCIYLVFSLFSKNIKRVVYFLIFILFLVLLVFILQKDNVKNRISYKSYDLQSLSLYLDSDKIVLTSSVIRFLSWEKGVSWFLEKPLLGHGSGKLTSLIENDVLFQKQFKGKFGHLHNSYLELLIAYGLIGFLLFFSVISVLVYDFITKLRSEKESLIKNNKFIFFLFFGTVWSVANFFESYIFYSSGVYINTFFFGYLFYVAYFERESIEDE